MRTYLVAVVAHTQTDLQNFLLASPHGPGGDGTIDCWWIAEDDSEDRNDCDTAIFVPRGSTADMSNLISQYCEAHQQEWDEDGYPYAGTDVSGVWYLPPDVRARIRAEDAKRETPFVHRNPTAEDEHTHTLPTDDDGDIVTSAQFGESVMVQIIWNTGPDHAPLDDEADYPSTFHGPFTTGDEAQLWMDAYPDDTEVHDMVTLPVNNVRG